DDAINRINSPDSDYDLIILDIMMPTPQGIASVRTGEGLDTGIWVLSEVKEALLKRSVPVLVLTNRAKPLVNEEVAKLGFPNGLVAVFAKLEVTSILLPVRVKTMIDQWNADQEPGV